MPKSTLYILTFTFFTYMNACKATKLSPSSKEYAFSKVDFKPEKGYPYPIEFTTFVLDTSLFDRQLSTQQIYLPTSNGEQQLFYIQESNTMSPAMKKRYPNLKAYKGYQLSNKATHCTVEKNKNTYTVMLVEHSTQYYLNKLQKNEVYFFYDRSLLPLDSTPYE